MSGTLGSAMRPPSLLSCDPTHKASAVFSWGPSGQGSASCWSKVTHQSCAGQQLMVLGYRHDNSYSITTRGWGGSLRLCCHTPLISLAASVGEPFFSLKIHFGNNFLEIWKDSQESFQLHCKVHDWTREASLKGTMPGSSYLNPHHSFPSFAGQQYSFLFGLKLQKVPQSFFFSFLYHLVEDCPVWFNIF